jgi:CelD/BcsL family acetyltransferase involved in cellulose biosynthesis
VNHQAIRDELARIERELVEVAARIEKQKAALSRLEATGENTAHASFLLEQSLGWQRLNEAHRARLKRELAQAQ